MPPNEKNALDSLQSEFESAVVFVRHILDDAGVRRDIDFNNGSMIVLTIMLIALFTWRLFWIFSFFTCGLIALFACIASIFHFQIIMAVGLLFIGALFFLGALMIYYFR